MPRDALRIALLAGTLGQGGAEKQLIELVRLARAAGLEVRVFSLTRGEYFESTLNEMGVPPVFVGRHALPPLRLLTVLREMKRFRPHVVQAAHGYVNLYAAAAGRLLGVPSFGALRGSVHACQRSNGLWTKPLLRSPHALLVNSESAIEELKGQTGPVPSAYLLPNTLPPCAASAPNDRRGECRVIWAGRAIPSKRLDRFIRAFALAREKNPRLTAQVLGDGPELVGAQKLASKLGLASGVLRFEGAVKQVDPYLAGADLLVFTSDNDEGVPNVILEAMAHGLPVVATRAGDSSRLVLHGVTGFICEADPASLAARMAELAADRELRIALGRKGRQHVQERHAPERLIPRLLAIYRAVAEQRGFRHLLPYLEN